MNDDLTALIYILAAIATIAGFVLDLTRGGQSLVRRTLQRLLRFRPRVPRETVRLVPRSPGHRWTMGAAHAEPAMQLHSNWYVTNIVDRPVWILRARIKAPATEGTVAIRQPDGPTFGTFPIMPHATTEASINFRVQPPVRAEHEDFRVRIVLTDQFGNDHHIQRVLFGHPPTPRPQPAQPPRESLHEIADPVEKQVAAVLKAEVERFREQGRSAGGMGSIQTTYQGRSHVGLGPEWRRIGVAEDQSIVPDPENARIESDNIHALTRLYESLGTDEERERFISALLRRLSKATEYAPVGYLAFLSLSRIGRTTEALGAAVRDLMGDDGHGFSDVLRLLDGLLRFEHGSFSEEDLDEVERLVENIPEHTFRIHERIAAIRAYRLRQRPGL